MNSKTKVTRLFIIDTSRSSVCVFCRFLCSFMFDSVIELVGGQLGDKETAAALKIYEYFVKYFVNVCLFTFNLFILIIFLSPSNV